FGYGFAPILGAMVVLAWLGPWCGRHAELDPTGMFSRRLPCWGTPARGVDLGVQNETQPNRQPSPTPRSGAHPVLFVYHGPQKSCPSTRPRTEHDHRAEERPFPARPVAPAR